MTDRTNDLILVRAQEVAEHEVSFYFETEPLTRDQILGVARRAYLQGLIDRPEELLRAVNSARNDVEIESTATAARSVA